MIDWTWITASATELLMVFLTAVGIYLVLLVLTRLAGLRSFSKMSGFDFAVTVAIGSVVASTILTKDPSLLVGAFALLMLYGVQHLASRLRRETETIEHLVDNEPLLVMAREEVLSEHLDEAQMTEDDLRSNLRLAGVTHPSQVLAVVLETTGDVAVMKSGDRVDPWLFEEVRGARRLNLPRDS